MNQAIKAAILLLLASVGGAAIGASIANTGYPERLRSLRRPGTVLPVGERIEFPFELTNPTDSSISISSVKQACVCENLRMAVDGRAVSLESTPFSIRPGGRAIAYLQAKILPGKHRVGLAFEITTDGAPDVIHAATSYVGESLYELRYPPGPVRVGLGDDRTLLLEVHAHGAISWEPEEIAGSAEQAGLLASEVRYSSDSKRVVQFRAKWKRVSLGRGTVRFTVPLRVDGVPVKPVAELQYETRSLGWVSPGIVDLGRISDSPASPSPGARIAVRSTAGDCKIQKAWVDALGSDQVCDIVIRRCGSNELYIGIAKTNRAGVLAADIVVQYTLQGKIVQCRVPVRGLTQKKRAGR